MKKKTLCSLLLLLLCLNSLTGCHGSEGLAAFEMPEEFDTSQNYEIVFWAKNDTNVTQRNIYDAAVEAFEELYPNITVTVRYYTDYSEIYNDVITNISTNTTPNVCITYPDHIATYMTGTNVVVPLSQFFTDEKYGFGGSELLYDGPEYDEIISNYLEECYIDDDYYAIPYMRSSEALYINKTYVEALGYEIPEVVTWDWIWEVADAATEKNEDGTYVVNGQTVMIPFIYKSTDNMLITQLQQLGADYSTSDGEILLFNDTTEELLLTIADHVATGAFSTFKISSYPANYLNAGQCIFAIDSTAGSTWMGSEAPLSDIPEESVVEFETVVTMVPQYDTENPQMISQGPSICIFNKEDPQEVLASWLFAQFLLTNEVQIAYAQTEGYVPVTTKAQNSSEYLDYLSRAGEDDSTYYQVKIDATELLLDNIDNTFTTEVFNGSASVRDAAGQMIEEVCKSVRRKETVDDEYIEDLYDDMVDKYHLDQLGSSGVGITTDLGELPSTAKILLAGLAITWVCIIAYVVKDNLKNRKNKA